MYAYALHDGVMCEMVCGRERVCVCAFEQAYGLCAVAVQVELCAKQRPADEEFSDGNAPGCVGV